MTFKNIKTAEQLATEQQVILNQERLNQINTRLTQIDLESVRPLRAINNGSETQADIDKLAALQLQADNLRAERAGLV